MAVRLSALCACRTLLPRNIIIFMFLVLISVTGWETPKALYGMKDYVNWIFTHFTGSRTRHFPAGSIEPTTHIDSSEGTGTGKIFSSRRPDRLRSPLNGYQCCWGVKQKARDSSGEAKYGGVIPLLPQTSSCHSAQLRTEITFPPSRKPRIWP
jgi:hypothetical protein